MPQENNSPWTKKATDASFGKKEQPKTAGAIIMEIAERLRPLLTAMYEGTRDHNGMLIQPAHIRGIALDVAQRIVREQKA